METKRKARGQREHFRLAWTAGMPEGVSSESEAEWDSRWLSSNLDLSDCVVTLQIPQDHDRSLWYRLISPRSLRSSQGVWELPHHRGVCTNQGLALKPARKCSLWLCFTLEFPQQREIKQQEVLARNVKHGVQRIVLPAVAGRFDGGSEQVWNLNTRQYLVKGSLRIQMSVSLPTDLSSIYSSMHQFDQWSIIHLHSYFVTYGSVCCFYSPQQSEPLIHQQISS